MKYLVLATEHDESYSNAPMVCGTFDTMDHAKEFIRKAVKKSLVEFPDEVEESFGVVRSFDENGYPTYGCVWSIVKVDDTKKKDVNKFGVPHESYGMWLENGNEIRVDIGNEDDWGNIQECVPGDCKDWENSIGWGNDADGHIKIVNAYSYDTANSWNGTDAVRSWFDTRVAVWAKNYSA